MDGKRQSLTRPHTVTCLFNLLALVFLEFASRLDFHSFSLRTLSFRDVIFQVLNMIYANLSFVESADPNEITMSHIGCVPS